ncbi:hypothetical protein PC120_g16429 [Phytophthora cactorum]|nr:hypothetical protein PC120_g16429 [Phytophthora cactorum]
MQPSLWVNNVKYFGVDFKPDEGDVHVLEVVPEQEQHLRVESGRDSAPMFREIMASQMRLKRRLERQRFEEALEYPHNKSKSSSFGTLGGIEIARLESDGLIIVAEAKENGEPFWAEETQDLADAIENEAAFTAFITPLFDKILHRCGMVFVNSERYEWLSQSSALKPDGFATHPGMFRTRPVPSDEVVRPNGFRFGEAEKELFDCLILFESKLTVTPAAFGQESSTSVVGR